MTNTKLTPRQSQALVQAATVNVAGLDEFTTRTLRSLVNRGLLVQLGADFHQVGGYRITPSGVARVQAFSPLTPIADANLPVAAPAPTADEILHLIDNPPTVAELNERRNVTAPVGYRLQYVRPNYGEYSHRVDAAITVLGTELVADEHRGMKTIMWFRGEDGVEQYRPVEYFTRTHVAREHYVAVDEDGNPQARPRPEFAPGDLLVNTPTAGREADVAHVRTFAVVEWTHAVILRNVDTGTRSAISADMARQLHRVEDLAYAEATTRLRCTREALRILDQLGVRTASQFLRARREQLTADIAQVEAEHRHVGD